MQDVAVGGYIPGKSVVHGLDPRLKLAALVVLLIMVFTADSVERLLGVASITIAVNLLTGLGMRIRLWGLKRFTWMLIIVFTVNIAAVRSGTLVEIYGTQLPVTWEGLGVALRFTIQLVLGISLALALTFTTMPSQLARSCEFFLGPLKILRVPVQEISLMLLLAMRFVPILQHELRTIVEAQKARGVAFEGSGLTDRARILIAALAPAVHAALRRADATARAMSARGFDPEAPRTAFRPPALGRADMVAAAILTAFACVHFGLLRA